MTDDDFAPKKFLGLSRGTLGHDGNQVATRFEYEGGHLDLRFEPEDLGAVVQYLLGIIAAKNAGEPSPTRVEPGTQMIRLPLLAGGLFSDPATPNAQLMFRMPGLWFSFETSRDSAIALSQTLSRSAVTLASQPPPKQE